MKKIALFFYLIVLAIGLNAQVTLNSESGNRAIEQGNCWGFGATSYTNTPSSVIAGSWSCRSNQLTNSLPTACWVKTPWMLVGDGNITFNAKFEGTAGTTRGIQVFYIPFDETSPYNEGTAVQFYTYDWPKPWSIITAQTFTIPLASAIINSTQVFKIRVSFVGTGGTARIISDDYSFPGTHWGDPSNNCNPLPDPVLDADDDGVPDGQDNTPNNPRTSYFTYFPSFIQDGTLAFEDQWPARGDYDFNDVVVNYRIETALNSSNNVVELTARFTLRASGASFRNGFGFQLDGIAPNKIISVTGNSVSSGSIYNFAANGLESGQNYATCIVFDNFYNVMQWPGEGIGINTDPISPLVPNVTLNVKMIFIDENNVPAPGGTVSNLQLTPDVFNFFIVSNQERGREIHLADRVPTSLANTSLFGTLQDDTNPGTGKYYKTDNNLPWGINILQGFDYPIEKAEINDAYLHFIEWAASSGNAYPEWFTDAPGNRNNSLIY